MGVSKTNRTVNAKEIQQRLRSLADPAVAASSARFFKKEHANDDVFLGLRAATLHQLFKEHRTLPINEVETLLQSNIHEERMLALLILVVAFRKASDSTRKAMHDFYLGNTSQVNNWDLVDASAPTLVGGYLLDKSRKPIHRLAKSGDLWERRIAVVATQHFFRNDDFADTLKVAEMLMDDDEDLIHKATGWMLREVGKRDRATLEGFLKQHCRRMPRTMLRTPWRGSARWSGRCTSKERELGAEPCPRNGSKNCK
jgi:3-methyladenine DNA glycosylase AlkD